MTSAILSVILLATVGADVEATKERETFLYITTSPPGAEVLVDGKRLGTTPGLFPFKPGIGRVIVELDGHDQHGEDITIRAGDIKRLRLRLKRKAEPKVNLPALSPDATLDSILARLNKPPNGWKVIESKSESADRLLESSEELGGRVEHVAMIGLSNRGKRIVVGVYESASSEDLAGIRDKALRSTVGLSRNIGHKPHPLACLTYGNTILTFFAADEVAPEFLGEALRELGFAEKSQVPLWADLLKQHEMRKQNRVTLVVGKERMSLEGKPMTWDGSCAVRWRNSPTGRIRSYASPGPPTTGAFRRGMKRRTGSSGLAAILGSSRPRSSACILSIPGGRSRSGW